MTGLPSKFEPLLEWVHGYVSPQGPLRAEDLSVEKLPHWLPPERLQGLLVLFRRKTMAQREACVRAFLRRMGAEA